MGCGGSKEQKIQKEPEAEERQCLNTKMRETYEKGVAYRRQYAFDHVETKLQYAVEKGMAFVDISASDSCAEDLFHPEHYETIKQRLEHEGLVVEKRSSEKIRVSIMKQPSAADYTKYEYQCPPYPPAAI